MPNWLLVTIIVVLALWLLGMTTSIVGGLVHILLIVAVILLIVWLVQHMSIRKQQR